MHCIALNIPVVFEHSGVGVVSLALLGESFAFPWQQRGQPEYDE
jgi:hypothetical protein